LVTRKITRGLARIAIGMQKIIYLGNLNARRDWGHAKDYVEMQWLMLQQKVPKDYVIATGRQHSVRDFVDISARELGIILEWQGEGLAEKGIVAGVDADRLPALCPSGINVHLRVQPGDCLVEIDSRYFRPAEVETLLGNAAQARQELGWSPRITFEEMVTEMIRHDLQEAARDHLCRTSGFSVFEPRE
jgi:GDPmannose 4,6-dehydratase